MRVQACITTFQALGEGFQTHRDPATHEDQPRVLSLLGSACIPEAIRILSHESGDSRQGEVGSDFRFEHLFQKTAAKRDVPCNLFCKKMTKIIFGGDEGNPLRRGRYLLL
jgi:hypothetical protein